MKIQSYIICLLLLALYSCSDKEKDFVFPEPQVVINDPVQPVIVQEAGKAVSLSFTLQAASGLQQLIVNQNDEEYDKKEYTQGEIASDYDFEYTVPEETPIGTKINFSINLSDKDGRQSSYDFVVEVNATYSITDGTIGATPVKYLKGKINDDFTIATEDTYVIDSIFSVNDGGVLTIEAGSTVYFRTSSNAQEISRLVIAQGSKIIAEGTRENPIVFTSDKLLKGETPTSADWGGIFIHGSAPINQGSTAMEEGFRYGGTVRNDDSGVLQFVRIEYVGKENNITRSNALSFYGVGSRTRVNHVQIYKNEHIAFRIKGGGFNLKNIAAIGHGGYGFWADNGWQGNGQFWIFQTERQATLLPVNFWNQARSIEFRNDDTFFEKTPRTQFSLANITLIGNGNGPNMGTRRGVRVRTGSLGRIQNLIVTQFPEDAVRVEDLKTAQYGTDMILANTRAFDNNVNYEGDAKEFFFNQGSFNVTEDAVSGVTTSNFVGSAPSTFNPASWGSFFSSANYIGAVENAANDWTKGGNWFRNSDGTFR